MRRATTQLAALSLFLAGNLGASSSAQAQEALDVGMLKDSDINVVQKMLYPKAGKMELGGHVGWMPFDTYTSTPTLTFMGALHLKEDRAVEVAIGGGYSLKNANYKVLESPTYGITPDAYRYLASVLVDYQVSPVYAKINWLGRKIVHHDLYGLAGAGATIEQAFLPDGAINIAPTVGFGIGTRIFLKNGDALRIQIRDDVLYQKRIKTMDSQGYFIKQNVGLSVGYIRLQEK